MGDGLCTVELKSITNIKIVLIDVFKNKSHFFVLKLLLQSTLAILVTLSIELCTEVPLFYV